MGRKIEETQREFNVLNSTRRNQLERPLRKIEELRTHEGGLTGFSAVENGALEQESSGDEKTENLLLNSQSHADD